MSHLGGDWQGDRQFDLLGLRQPHPARPLGCHHLSLQREAPARGGTFPSCPLWVGSPCSPDSAPWASKSPSWCCRVLSSPVMFSSLKVPGTGIFLGGKFLLGLTGVLPGAPRGGGRGGQHRGRPPGLRASGFGHTSVRTDRGAAGRDPQISPEDGLQDPNPAHPPEEHTPLLPILRALPSPPQSLPCPTPAPPPPPSPLPSALHSTGDDLTPALSGVQPDPQLFAPSSN